jgi:hypothetical protein
MPPKGRQRPASKDKKANAEKAAEPTSKKANIHAIAFLSPQVFQLTKGLTISRHQNLLPHQASHLLYYQPIVQNDPRHATKRVRTKQMMEL